MKLRVVASIVLAALACASMIGLYNASKGPQSLGIGGLPLIKADISPIKVPPDETQRDPLNIPNSTIFEALNEGDRVETPKMPDDKQVNAPHLSLEAPAPEFAGFRTGFALPEAPAPKKENLFAPLPEDKTPEQPKIQAKQEATVPVPQVIAAVTPKIETPAKKITVPITQAKSETKAQPNKTVDKPVKTAAKPVNKPADKPVVKTATATPAKPLPKPPVLAAVKTKLKEPTAQTLEQQELALMNAPYVPKKQVMQNATEKAVLQKSPIRVTTKAPNQKDDELSSRRKNKNAENAIIKPANIEPAAGNISPVAAPTPANHYIQLTSAPNQESAAKAWSIKSSRYGAALGGLSPIYQRVSINGKDFVRLRAGPFTAVEANKRCAMLKAVDASGGCLVTRQ